MASYLQTKREAELKSFANRNFEPPSRCRNLEQIRYYIRELCDLIEKFESEFADAPSWAYKLLSQYNERQNSFLRRDFMNTYC
jgi:hypothetical protein